MKGVSDIEQKANAVNGHGQARRVRLTVLVIKQILQILLEDFTKFIKKSTDNLYFRYINRWSTGMRKKSSTERHSVNSNRKFGKCE